MITSFNPALTTREFIGRANDVARRDAEILARCHALAPWGLVAAIDLGGCDPRAIRDARQIERFAIALCDLIGVRRLGDPIVVRLGDGSRVSGYSLAQLIETSLISGHFDEESDRAYIDIFSRKPYSPYQAAEFCRGWFGAATVRVSITLRQAEEHSVDTISYG
jgi:S-adenosylmethionine/arginine decarboxylase-like enzyme